MIYCPFYMCISIYTQQRLITQKLLLQVITKSDQSVYCIEVMSPALLWLFFVFYLAIMLDQGCAVYLGPSSLGFHSGPENLKMSRQKKPREIKYINFTKKFFWTFSWKIFSFKLFPSINIKIDFWPFLKSRKMDFAQENFFMKLIYLIWRNFWPEFFKKFFGLLLCVLRVLVFPKEQDSIVIDAVFKMKIIFSLEQTPNYIMHFICILDF